MGPQFMYIYGVPSQSVVTFRFTGRTSYAIDWGLWCDRDAGTHFHDFTPECVSLSSHIAQPTNSWYSTNHDKKGFFKTSSKCYIITFRWNWLGVLTACLLGLTMIPLALMSESPRYYLVCKSGYIFAS